MKSFNLSTERTDEQDKEISDALYRLRPFQRMKVGVMYVFAVPGGWIMEIPGGEQYNHVFVPWTNTWQVRYSNKKQIMP